MSRRPPKLTSTQIDATAADWVLRREAGLNEREQADYSEWLAQDPQHAAAVARHDEAWSLLDRPRNQGTAHALADALARRTHRRSRLRWSASGLAMALLTIGLFWLRPGSPVGTGAAGTALVLNPTREFLPDGSRVELRSGATFSVDYDGAQRRITLRSGEALFQVVKDPQRPFIVTAAGIEVRAVGTAFLVDLGETRVDVIVTEGQVAVNPTRAPTTPLQESAPARTEAARAPTLVDAGRRLVVGLAPDQGTPEPVDISKSELNDRLSWRATRLEFSYTPLAEAIALMNQHSEVKMVIDDPDLATLPVNGLFRADNSETLLRLLEANFDVISSRTGNVLTLRRRRN